MTLSWKTGLGLAAGGLLVGLVLGWCWGKPSAPVQEPPAASYVQKDGSTVLARVNPATQPAKPPHELPAGSVEERRISVVVQPGPGRIVHDTIQVPLDYPAGAGNKIDSIVERCECPPVQVDLSLVRTPDHGRRVIASSPDGKILSGVDVPLEPAAVPRIPTWTLSAIATADLDGVRPGILLTRRLGPIVVGGGLLSDPGLRRPGAIAQFGVTW